MEQTLSPYIENAQDEGHKRAIFKLLPAFITQNSRYISDIAGLFISTQNGSLGASSLSSHSRSVYVRGGEVYICTPLWIYMYLSLCKVQRRHGPRMTLALEPKFQYEHEFAFIIIHKKIPLTFRGEHLENTDPFYPGVFGFKHKKSRNLDYIGTL